MSEVESVVVHIRSRLLGQTKRVGVASKVTLYVLCDAVSLLVLISGGGRVVGVR